MLEAALLRRLGLVTLRRRACDCIPPDERFLLLVGNESRPTMLTAVLLLAAGIAMVGKVSAGSIRRSCVDRAPMPARLDQFSCR
jgi:hypothetical protein